MKACGPHTLALLLQQTLTMLLRAMLITLKTRGGLECRTCCCCFRCLPVVSEYLEWSSLRPSDPHIQEAAELCSRSWAPTTHVQDLGRVPSFCLEPDRSPAVGNTWGVNQQIQVLFLLLAFPFKQIKVNK